MAEYAVNDKHGTRWDYLFSKAAAETSRKALDKRQPDFKPFKVVPVEERKK